MGARWMQQKLLKEKKRKAKARQSSMKSFMSDAHGISKDRGNPFSFVSRNKAAMAIEDTHIKPRQLPLEQQPINAIHARAVQGNPRAVVLERLWQGEVRGQGIDGFQRVKMLEFGHKKIFMFFAGPDFFFVEEDDRSEIVKRSIIYGSRDRALAAYRNDRIRWLRNTTYEELKKGLGL